MPLWKRRAVLSIVLLVITLSLSLCSVYFNQQLFIMGGMAEEYFDLGINLLTSGNFSMDNKIPCLLRPPGYPFFIAVVTGIRHEISRFAISNPASQEQPYGTFDDVKAVYLSQCVLLALSTMLLFLWMSRYLHLANAFIMAGLFGCNPYMIILTGLLHYDILHVFFIILSSYVFYCAVLNNGRKQVFLLALAGILWGLCTLVRLVTLILPVFVLIFFTIRFRLSKRLALRNTIVFTAAMALTIMPYTIRNYIHTDRIIGVNAQSKVALWAATAQKLQPSPNYFRWWNLWSDQGMRIYRRVTNSSTYSYEENAANIIRLEDEFAKEAALNLRNKPGVYIGNILRNIRSITLDINSIFIKVFQFIQQPGTTVEIKWFGPGYPQDFYLSYGTTIFEALAAILTLFSFFGISIALVRKDASLAVSGLVFLCLCLAHSMTVLDMMHYYIKMPFLFIFAAYFTNALSNYHLDVPFARWKIQPVNIIYALMAGLTIGLIFIIQLKLPSHVQQSAITSGKGTIASSIFESNPEFGPGKAVDTDARTYWAAETSARQAWLEIDFGKTATFNRIVINELCYRIRHFNIQIKEGDEWKTVIIGGLIGSDYRRQFEPITARYVRLNILDAISGPIISEFQLLPGTGPVTTGTSATASDFFGDNTAFGPDKAVDCNAVTNWATNPQTRQAWLEIDLGKPKMFNQVRIIEELGRVQRYDLQIKENDNWQTILSGEQIGSDYYMYFIPVTARYVRLNITASVAAPAICEFQLFEPDP